MQPLPPAPPARPTAADNRRGIAAMMLAMGLFVANDSLAKMAREALPPGEVMFIRGIFASLAALVLVFAMGQARQWPMVAQGRVVMRAALELIVALAFISALGHMPLADLTAITQSTPIIMAVACSVLGLEVMGWRRWLAVLVGFGGVLLVVRPGGAGFDIYSVLALTSAVLVAVRDLVTRGIAGHVPTVLILLATAVLVMLGGLAMSTIEEWQPVTLPALLQLAAAGLLVTAGHFYMITAFRNVEIGVVSPFRYSVILWAELSGILIFGEVPEFIAVLGAMLIAGSGLYTVHRERVRARSEKAAIAALGAEKPLVAPK
jgi:drug/metabolite transporter (DMT)-like permease